MNKIGFLVLVIKLGIFLLICFCSPLYAASHRSLTADEVKDITASSFLDNNDIWSPKHAIDGLSQTPWVPHRDDGAKGAWIQVNLKQTSPIQKIGLINGFARDETAFKINHRIRRARLVFADGQEIPIKLKDDMSLQLIEVNRISSDFVRLIIEDIYPSSKYPHTCLAEMKIYIADSVN